MTTTNRTRKRVAVALIAAMVLLTALLSASAVIAYAGNTYATAPEIRMDGWTYGDAALPELEIEGMENGEEYTVCWSFVNPETELTEEKKRSTETTALPSDASSWVPGTYLVTLAPKNRPAAVSYFEIKKAALPLSVHFTKEYLNEKSESKIDPLATGTNAGSIHCNEQLSSVETFLITYYLQFDEDVTFQEYDKDEKSPTYDELITFTATAGQKFTSQDYPQYYSLNGRRANDFATNNDELVTRRIYDEDGNVSTMGKPGVYEYRVESKDNKTFVTVDPASVYFTETEIPVDQSYVLSIEGRSSPTDGSTMEFWYTGNPVEIFVTYFDHDIFNSENDNKQMTDVRYSLDGTTWSSNVPQIVELGEYDLHYYIKHPKCEKLSGTVKIKICPAGIYASDLLWDEIESVSYDGTVHTVKIPLNPDRFSKSVYLLAVAADGSDIKNAGEYLCVPEIPDEFAGQIFLCNGEDEPLTAEQIAALTHKVTVNALPVTVTANSASVVYGDEPKDNGYRVFSPAVPDTSDLLDELIANVTVSFEFGKDGTPYAAGSDAGIYGILPVVTWKEGAAHNFAVTAVAGNLEVAKKTVEVYWMKTQSTMVYTGEDNEFKAVFLVNGNPVDLITDTATPFRDAGAYRVFVSLPEEYRNNYVIPDAFTSRDYVIEPVKVTKPVNTAVYVYNGEEQTFEIPENENYVVENATRTDAGSQTVTVRLLDTNHMWEDGTSDVLTFTFTINPLTIKKPTDATFTYDGTEKALDRTVSKYYEIINNTRTEVGEQTVTAKLTNANVTWEDGTTGTLLLKLKVNKISVAKPVSVSATYDNADHAIDTSDTRIAFTGTLTGKTAGTYRATATLADADHYEWSDGTTAPIDLTIQIAKAAYDMTGVSFGNIVALEGDTVTPALTGTLPSGLDGIAPTVSFTPVSTESAGVFTVSAKFATTSPNYEVPSDLSATLTVQWVQKKQDVGSDGETKGQITVVSENGIDPDTRFVALKIEETEEIKTVSKEIKESEAGSKHDRIFAVYDVSLLKGNDKVQPDGTLTVYLPIPEELIDADFRILHLHEGESAVEITYEIEDGYAVIKTTKLSEFAFVCDQVSLLWLILLLSFVILLAGAALAFQIKKGIDNGSFGSGKLLGVAAPIFYVPGHVPAVVALAIVAGVLILANVAVFIYRKRKA